MNLASLALSGFKGQNRTHHFEPGINAIVGPNASGKTSILEALEFVCNGSVQGFPAQNGPLMDAFGSGTMLEVVAGWSDGTMIKRGLARDGTKCSMTKPKSASPIAPLFLNSSLFLAAKPKDRARMILEAAGASPTLLTDITGKYRFQDFKVKWEDGETLSQSLDNLRTAIDARATTIRGIVNEMKGLIRGMNRLEAEDIPAMIDTAPLSATLTAALEALNRQRGRLVELERTTARRIVEPTEPRPAHCETSSATVLGKDIAALEIRIRTADTQQRALSTWKLNLVALETAADEAAKKHIDTVEMKDGVCSACGAKSEHWDTTHHLRAIEQANRAERKACEALDAHKRAQPAAGEDTEPLINERDAKTQARDELIDAGVAREAWTEFDRATAARETALAEWAKADAEVPALELATTNARTALQAAEANNRDAEQAQAGQRTLVQAEDRLKEAESDLTNLLTAKEKFEAELSEEMNRAMRPIMQTCEMFTAGIFDTMLTVRDLEIGRFAGPAWIGVDSMSGSEMRVVTCAIKAALASRAPGVRLVSIDEFSVIDDTRKPRVLSNLAQACVEGVLDQVLILDNRPVDTEKIRVLWPTSGPGVDMKEVKINTIQLEAP